jgi:hypothetical protein
MMMTMMKRKAKADKVWVFYRRLRSWRKTLIICSRISLSSKEWMAAGLTRLSLPPISTLAR